MKHKLLGGAALLIALLASSVAWAEPKNSFNIGGAYQFTTIRFPNSSRTDAFGINGDGDIVGSYIDQGDEQHGFLRADGKYKTIDHPAAAATAARGINDAGDIVGTYFDEDGIAHGFLLRNGVFRDIDVPGSIDTLVAGINDKGHIMGTWVKPNGTGHGFYLKDGNYTTMNVPGADDAQVYSAQDDGKVRIGQAFDEVTGGPRGFIRSAPGQFEFVDFPGLEVHCTALRSINESGVMAGLFADVDTVEDCFMSPDSHGFLLVDGDFKVIDFPGGTGTAAMGINDDGVIVGRYINSNGKTRGFRAVLKD
jgi:probable HAF family extracellular repeat protein